MRSSSLLWCEGSVFGSVRLPGHLQLQASSTCYRFVATRLVAFGADGLHPLPDDAAFTNFAGGDGSLTDTLPYHSDVRCRLERTERLGRTSNVTLQPPNESPQGAQRVSTLVKRSETPRFLSNENNAIGRSNQTKTEAASSSVAAVLMDQWRRRHQRVCTCKEHFPRCH